MTRILYIGNKLNHSNSNVTTIETLGSHLSAEGYHLIYSSSKINKVIRLWDMMTSVVKNRSRVKYVLIDTYSTQNFYYALVVSMLCRLFKLKYIPILHGGNLPKRLQKSKNLSDIIFKKAHAIVSPSIYLKKIFNENGYDNITFIPNSINLENYPFQNKKIETPKLFWLRSYKKLYNPLMAIHVAKGLIDKGFDCELCMVGPDGDGSFLKAKKLAEEFNLKVDFNLKMEKDKWIKLSYNYNIFINTTNFDNLPVSVIEAMALGFPVVSTNVGGIPYLLEDGKSGLLVAQNDIEKMTSQIIKLINQPELAKKISLNARAQVEEFDWKVVKNKWKTLLK